MDQSNGHFSEVCFDAELIRRYDHNGPRYTSYPTSPQFHSRFDAAHYRVAASASNTEKNSPLSLYVHVPFCASPCFYCGCNKVITRDPVKAEQYLLRLMREIQLQGELFNRHRVVEQLHFGGGTPTFLTSEQLGRVFAALDAAFTLTTGDTREYSIEIDPRTIDRDGLAALANFGCNRISLGIQDFDARVQQAVNRVQSVAATLQLVADARELDFKSISFDLIYGLPLQTPQSFATTLDIVLQARPDRLAVYGYAHMPQLFKPQRHIRATDLPTAAARLELLHLTIDKLTAAGYVYIGMDHFALPTDELVTAQRAGSLQRNFQGYSTHADCDLVGLGVSSIGKIGNTYAQNAKTLPTYYAALDRNELAVERGITLTSDDLIRRAVIQQLMCNGSVVFADIEHTFSINFERYFNAELLRLNDFAADDLLTINHRRIDLQPKGRLLLRSVAMVFDAYLSVVDTPLFSKVI